MGLMSLGIGQDPASEADREDRAGNHSVCDLKIIFFRDLVVSAVDAAICPAPITRKDRMKSSLVINHHFKSTS